MLAEGKLMYPQSIQSEHAAIECIGLAIRSKIECHTGFGSAGMPFHHIF
jgi:hypothetical protein